MRINKKKAGKSALFILASFGVLMYVRTRLIPRYADDYPFSFIWDGKHHGNLAFGDQRYRRVRKGRDLVRSQVSHYLTWSGRTVGESLNQLFLIPKDKHLFDLTNTAVIISQILLSDWIGSQRIRIKSIPASLMKALTMGFWFGTPHLCSTALWQTGAMNYSWPGVLQSLFLLPYSLSGKNRELKVPVWPMVIAGLLAGWSNEAGGGIACLLAGARLFKDARDKRVEKWKVYGFVSACIGYALLMLAPGNFNRFKLEKEYSDILPDDFGKSGSVPSEYVYKPEMFAHFFKSSFIGIILRLLPLQLPVILCLSGADEMEKDERWHIITLEAATLLVPVILMFSPEFPKRAAYPCVIYAMSAMSAAWDRVDMLRLIDREESRSEYGGGLQIIEHIMEAYLLINVIASLIVDADWGGQIRDSINMIREGKGEALVTVPQTVVPPVWSAIAGDRAIDKETHEIGRFEENIEDPYNKAAAAYYGVGAVKTTDGSEHSYNRNKTLMAQLYMPLKNILRYF